MSAGAVFKLIANDGKADRMIMATKLLNQRIKDIMCMRMKSGFDDPTPTLVDIEKTHILFVNAHFKPFAAIGYEYNKVMSTSGTPAFGANVQFSIPQFGDFFHDMVVHTVLSSVTTTEGTVPNVDTLQRIASTGGVACLVTSGSGEGVGVPAGVTGKIVVEGDVLAATRSAAFNAGLTTYHVNLYTRRFVDAAGNTLASGTVAQNYVRYCELPGLRAFSKVEFKVNGNPLDDYTTEAYLYHDKFNVQPNKRLGWNRLVGQEVPVAAVSDILEHDNFNSVCSAGVVDMAGSAVGMPVGNNTSRQQTQVLDGPQTPKLVQPALEMWIPLLFWFNKDARLSIASVSIPYGQRIIEISVAPRSKLLFLAPGNVYMETRVECYELDMSAGASPAAWNWSDLNASGDLTVNYSVLTSVTPVLISNSVLVDSNSNEVKLNLYINNIFVNPEIHDIYIKRIGFSLIRVHRLQVINVNQPSVDSLMSNLKWPVETVYTGIRPTYNEHEKNLSQHRDWHHLQRLHNEHVYEKACGTALSFNGTTFIGGLPARADVTLSGSQAASINAGLVGGSAMCVTKDFVYPKSEKTVDRLKVTAHGIPIYNDFPAEFFSHYSPYVWGGQNINCPEDDGALMVNFCLYPGTYQPSGHLNISRAREFYIQYTSSYVGRAESSNGPDDYKLANGESGRPGDLITLAIAINFLLISDGSAVLRYST
jgi:hypothetical protein